MYLWQSALVKVVLGGGSQVNMGGSEAPCLAKSRAILDGAGGNLNYAFAVRDPAGGGVFVKQAPDYIKVD